MIENWQQLDILCWPDVLSINSPSLVTSRRPLSLVRAWGSSVWCSRLINNSVAIPISKLPATIRKGLHCTALKFTVGILHALAIRKVGLVRCTALKFTVGILHALALRKVGLVRWTVRPLMLCPKYLAISYYFHCNSIIIANVDKSNWGT